MTWYAAHIIQLIKFLDGVQDSYPLYENIVLIQADSSSQAWETARTIGLSIYNEDGATSTTTENDRPAALVFAGVRKIIECENFGGSGPSRLDKDFVSTHGTEISHSGLQVDSAEALAKLVNGEPALVLYEE